MPNIEIILKTESDSLVGVEVELFSWNASLTKTTKHKLTNPVHSEGKFIYKSIAKLSTGRYGLWLHTLGVGRSTEAEIKDGQLVDPPGTDWPFKVMVPASQTQYSDTCYFTVGDAS